MFLTRPASHRYFRPFLSLSFRMIRRQLCLRLSKLGAARFLSCSADCYICSAGIKDTPPVTRFFWPAFKAFSFICCRSAPPATELRHTHRTHTPHTLHTPSVSLPTRIPLQPQTSESHPLPEDILADSANILKKVFGPFHATSQRLFAEYF